MSLKIIDQLQEAIKQEERIANKNARKHKERIAKLEKKLLQAFEALPVLPSIVASENIKELQEAIEKEKMIAKEEARKQEERIAELNKTFRLERSILIMKRPIENMKRPNSQQRLDQLDTLAKDLFCSKK